MSRLLSFPNMKIRLDPLTCQGILAIMVPMTTISLNPADPTHDDSRICRVEGCRRTKSGASGYVKRHTTCKRHINLGVAENPEPATKTYGAVRNDTARKEI